jgi:cell division protein FtsQ
VARDVGDGVSTRLARPPLRVLIASAVGLVLVLALWFWLRDSSLVAVRTVDVSGIYGPQAAQVRAALETAGRSMTTLHVRRDALDTAVKPFALVKRLEVSTNFPHTLRIHVVTNVAVAAVVAGGQRIPVTADGTLLRDVPASASASLPTIPLRSAPAGERLTGSSALADVAVLGAAPAALRGHVSGVSETSAHGLSVQLSHGPALWFGDRGRLVAKWAAAAAVLADPQSAAAGSIDVSAPERPAVGGLPGGAPATGASDVPTPPPGTDTTTTGAATTTQTTPGG